jgi:hypothetical protein
MCEENENVIDAAPPRKIINLPGSEQDTISATWFVVKLLTNLFSDRATSHSRQGMLKEAITCCFLFQAAADQVSCWIVLLY